MVFMTSSKAERQTLFKADRASGVSRLESFIPRAGRDYARLRNTDFGVGKHTAVSTLSPYIRHRLITEHEVVEAVLNEHTPQQSEKYIQEVFWRTYFKGWLEHHPQVWTRYQQGVLTALNVLSKDRSLRAGYEQALGGETGIACFDYWVTELIDTGYLHNHSRMWFASIWIFTLRLPWELGADFFLRNLIDGDPASNTLSWRWVAGLHTKGKTYLARPDNIARFTENRFNPQGRLALEAKPLIEVVDLIPDHPLPSSDILPDAPFLLLVHEDDCYSETLLPANKQPSSAAGIIATSKRSPLLVSQNVTDFARGAVNDALARIGTSLAIIEGNYGARLIAACEAADVKHIVTAYAPVGPVAQVLAEIESELNFAGITLTQILRSWDRFTWPYANRGFFKVKKKIPKILADLKSHSAQGSLF